MSKISLTDATADQIFQELHTRGYYQFMGHKDIIQALEKIYEVRRRGEDHQLLLDKLFWDAIGRIA